ncbi:hypothetical protein F5884DRAFT_340849 [Xylogone sp. PMI_703]|nr:hypothetical protein F5884DRAFT_340849 [Xylogone sp. PMI_703]
MWDEKSIPDLTGKVMLITGGNAGIGYQVVKQLAAHGAKVYMGARSESRAKKAIEQILSQNPSIPKTQLIWLPLDLSNLSSVSSAVQELASKEDRLDVLVNNAGIAAEIFETDKNGFELTMAVNHIGHFVLTTKLLPLLKATALRPESDVRIVTVSSSAESFAPKDNSFSKPSDLNDPCAKPGKDAATMAVFRRYGLSKLANILFTRELQRKLDQEEVQITVMSLNPGGVSTEGGIGVWPAFVRPFMKLLFAPPEKGALTPLFVATSKEIATDRKRWKGQFVGGPGKINAGTARSQDMQLAKSLWETTETALKAAGIDYA